MFADIFAGVRTPMQPPPAPPTASLGLSGPMQPPPGMPPGGLPPPGMTGKLFALPSVEM
jgi:hypothetical protein